jgi:NAD(P)-dependent dehydrogenase (short-subunit alcohol dehydrogenase family)
MANTNNKTAIVTGGSRGLGRNTTVNLAAAVSILRLRITRMRPKLRAWCAR